jgi:hypothetical protein
MTLPVSGAISLYNIAVELGISNSSINLNQANVRALAGKPGGSVSLNDLRGKSSAPPVTTFSMTAGISGDGFAVGYAREATLNIGSLSNAHPGKFDILQLNSNLSSYLFFSLNGAFTASYLTSIKINGFTLLGSAASFSVVNGNVSQWIWFNTNVGISSGNNYSVDIS